MIFEAFIDDRRRVYVLVTLGVGNILRIKPEEEEKRRRQTKME